MTTTATVVRFPRQKRESIPRAHYSDRLTALHDLLDKLAHDIAALKRRRSAVIRAIGMEATRLTRPSKAPK